MNEEIKKEFVVSHYKLADLITAHTILETNRSLKEITKEVENLIKNEAPRYAEICKSLGLSQVCVVAVEAFDKLAERWFKFEFKNGEWTWKDEGWSLDNSDIEKKYMDLGIEID